MKKISSIAAALFMATAFCGVCAGCASEISEKSESKHDAPPVASVTADEQYKVILCPGSYYSGNEVKSNTVGAGATKLNAADEEAYFVTNAYFATVAAGTDLPDATTGRAKTTFQGWTYAKDGIVETVAKMPASLDSDLYLYASWKTDGNITNPGTDPTPGESYVQVGSQKYTLTRNTGNTTREEYWIGENKITLAKGNVIQIYMDGQLIPVYVEGSSSGINKPAESEQVNSVTVSVAGQFAIYLHKNANDWSCEFAGPTAIDIGTEIPAGCAAVHVTFGNGDITFYLQDSNGNAVGANNLSNYCLYTYNNELFGNWATSATRGRLSSEMSSTATITADGGWIFRWGSNYGNQTANITGLEIGGKYLIKLPATNNGDATVTKLNV